MPLGIDASFISAFLQVIFIDLVLAGDNAVVIGLAAAGLPKQMRGRAILIGIAAATVMRIGFALITTQLLAITGLLLAGGLLLLWVCWKMYEELRVSHAEQEAAADAAADAVAHPDAAMHGSGANGAAAPQKTLRQAVTQIIIADVSMSLDNVLAVAGAAQHHLEVLVFGLILSVALMGIASAFIAKLLNRYRWIAWIGLVIILYVALKMVYEGADQLLGYTLPHIPFVYSGHAPVAAH
ncbi:membrane protein [Devosia geojensis]|uniref:Membrane protein n=1 Tax=Devosia geojensis TaxID=443610 RepID=A0A0F5FR25_9HYPH|nr:TerC family protein [Devosia geojensis]KKB10617.1 membrane protein [Devosia geojensis]